MSASAGHRHHIIPPTVYLAVFLVLLAGTMLTVWVAFHNFGIWNKPIALGIAVVKATLVVLYFMHVRYSSRLTGVVILVSVAMLMVLLGFTASDYVSRDTMRQQTRRVFYVEEPPLPGSNAAHKAGESH
jgi:cytochrome c oxidase subunit 4